MKSFKNIYIKIPSYFPLLISTTLECVNWIFLVGGHRVGQKKKINQDTKNVKALAGCSELASLRNGTYRM